MNFFSISTIITISGTLTMIFVYIYLFALYRERYIGFWILSWFIHFLRIIIFDSGMANWMESEIGFSLYQLMSISNALIFAWGTHLFIGRSSKSWWLYSAITASIISYLLTLMKLPIFYKLFLPAWFCGIIYIWTGFTFMRHLKIKGVGKLITEYVYIIWGIHTLDMPFLIDVAWFAPWGYLIDGILRFIIVFGTLLVYFEKTRVDLINKETQYRLLAENAVDVIYHYRLLPETKFEYISPSILAITGYAPEEFYSNPGLMSTLIYSDDRTLFDSFLNNPSQFNSIPLSLRIVRKDKNVIWTEQKFAPMYDEGGRILTLEGIIRDVTARVNFEQVASRVDRLNMVGNMAATVAHEIRNPITTVRGYLQMLGKKQEFQDNKSTFGLMIDELDRANSIISEYLSLAKEKRIDLKLCNLNNIIQSLFPLLEADAAATKAIINLDLSEIPELYLDENEIRQLLLNMVRNALEAMPREGQLSIGTFLEQDNAVLAISDRGTGIPAHILDKLGTPFVTTKTTGTGLGLPMCYRIAHRHNASIHVETSEQGTTFFICFNIH